MQAWITSTIQSIIVGIVAFILFSYLGKAIFKIYTLYKDRIKKDVEEENANKKQPASNQRRLP